MLALDTITLIDSASYACYRASATLSWWKKFQPDDNRSSDELLQDNDFLKYLWQQYTKGINTYKNRIFVRDCPIDTIWRLKHHDGYKAGRGGFDKGNRPMGPMVKWLNAQVLEKDLGPVVRVAEAEADDVIAVYVNYIIQCNPNTNITIISLDSDLIQLISWGCNIEVYNPKSKTTCNSYDEAIKTLSQKIIKGDSTDKVPSCSQIHTKADPLFAHIHNSILVNLRYIPRYIRDRAMKTWPLDASILHPFRHIKIHLGLCCINTYMREQWKPVFCSRTVRLQTVVDKGIDILVEKAILNCKDLITMIKWCAVGRNPLSPLNNHAQGVPVRLMRMSSDLLPHMCNPKLPDMTGVSADEIYQTIMDAVDPLFKKAGELAVIHGLRLTFHPGQYNVVGTPHEDKFINTVNELQWHADVLDRMGCDQNSVIVVHGGGMYGNKEETIKRWMHNFGRLPKNVQRRLVLENCEHCFHVEDCLRISESINIPTVFDTHHYDCYNILHPKEQLQPAEAYIDRILQSWTRRNIKPKFHVSEQRSGSRTGAHSDMIETLPSYLLDIPDKFDIDIDIMIEAKLKEQAIRYLYNKYTHLDPEYITKAAPIKKIRAKLKSSSKFRKSSLR
jgi:UV damage endonuclease UvdE